MPYKPKLCKYLVVAMSINNGNKPFVVLSAEDDEDYFRLLKMILTRELKVENLEHVSDGDDLVNYMNKIASLKNESARIWPSIILLDLNMPKKNGLEALTEIRQNPSIPLIPVIIFTVSSDLEDIERSYKTGANAFITKPTELKDLISTLQSAINFWGKNSLAPSHN